MPEQFALDVDARLESLPRLRAFVEDACARVRADPASTFALKLAVDEACTNIIVHAPPAGEPIHVTLGADDSRVTVTVRDHTAAFDPADAPPPDLTSALPERRTGGLGWYLVFKKMDEVHYQSDPVEGNVLTLVKRLAIAREA